MNLALKGASSVAERWHVSARQSSWLKGLGDTRAAQLRKRSVELVPVMKSTPSTR
jgi:hypothetical protein